MLVGLRRRRRSAASTTSFAYVPRWARLWRSLPARRECQRYGGLADLCPVGFCRVRLLVTATRVKWFYRVTTHDLTALAEGQKAQLRSARPLVSKPRLPEVAVTSYKSSDEGAPPRYVSKVVRAWADVAPNQGVHSASLVTDPARILAKVRLEDPDALPSGGVGRQRGAVLHRCGLVVSCLSISAGRTTSTEPST